MTILAIDTSFDDTAAAVVNNRIVLSNVLSTDLAVHLEYGGVVPHLARQAHERNIDPVISLALKRAHVTWDQIDTIAVTRGPGLAICLEIGIAKAKELASTHKKPLVAVNHMEGHLLSFLAQKPVRGTSTIRHQSSVEDFFPLMGILLSGGHTQFVYAKHPGNYTIVGQTKDDAVGEAYDKIGRMLGLGYPAGAVVERVAREGKVGEVVFPVPMRQVKDANTSFSGLKTAAMRIVEQHQPLNRESISSIALGFQTATIKHLTEKLSVALAGREVKTLAAGGGVFKNLAIRKALRAFAKEHNLPIYFPVSGKMCTDNAAMIGIAAAVSPKHPMETMDRLPTWSLEAL